MWLSYRVNGWRTCFIAGTPKSAFVFCESALVITKATPTATCDKAGQPNDVCPRGQVMSASPNDVAFGNDVVPSAQWANITSLRPSGATSLRAKRVTSFLRKQKHHFLPPESKTQYHTLYLAGKKVRKTDEIFSSVFDLILNCFMVGTPRSVFCFTAQRSLTAQGFPSNKKYRPDGRFREAGYCYAW